MGSLSAVAFSDIETTQGTESQPLLAVLGVEHCGVEYQPIIGLHDQKVYAYEALARFYRKNNESVSPLSVFQSLHSNPQLLGKTELQLKLHQIRFAPEGTELFINLDPHAVTDEVHGLLMALLEQKENLVVELIENTDLLDSKASIELLQALRGKGINCALDDVGARESMLSIDLMVAVDYLKFDRRWLNLLDQPKYEELLRCLLNFARAAGRTTILEGVETQQQLARVQQYPLDYIQGFLFRDQFIHTELLPL